MTSAAAEQNNVVKYKNNKLKNPNSKKYQPSSSQSSTMLSKSSSSGSSDTEPFYLHPPSIRQTNKDGGGGSMYVAAATGGQQHGPKDHNGMYGSVLPNDGLFVNPMRTGGSTTPTSPSGSVSGESFYLHDPQEVIYNRVKDLFDSDCSSSTKESPTMNHPNAMTGKVENSSNAIFSITKNPTFRSFPHSSSRSAFEQQRCRQRFRRKSVRFVGGRYAAGSAQSS